MGSEADKSIGPHCMICGRPLSAPESVAAGIGPICAGNILSRSYDTKGVYFADKELAITEDQLLKIALPQVEANPEFKDLRKVLKKNNKYRRIRIQYFGKKRKEPPEGYPTLLRWLFPEAP